MGMWDPGRLIVTSKMERFKNQVCMMMSSSSREEISMRHEGNILEHCL